MLDGFGGLFGCNNLALLHIGATAAATFGRDLGGSGSLLGLSLFVAQIASDNDGNEAYKSDCRERTSTGRFFGVNGIKDRVDLLRQVL